MNTKQLFLGFVFVLFLFGPLMAQQDELAKIKTTSVDAIKVWSNEMMAPNPDKINAITGLPQRYGTKDEPGSENIVRWCVNGGNEGDYMKISSDGPASGPYAMKIGMTEIPTGMNCWLDLRRSDMVVPGYNIPFDASGTDRVTFWIKAEEGTAPLWFMAQSFEPNFEPATNPDYGEKQLTVNAFIDGETIIMEDGTGELKTLRDTHFNGEWQFVSLPWKFLTMKDSAAVDALLPWSLAWEGSTKDGDGDNTEFDVSRIRTLKWFPKPESDGLMNKYWASAENLWGPPGILALPGEWEVDEIMFDRYNTWQASKSEIDVWSNEMMAPNPDKINAITGLPQRYGTKDEPGSENIVRWCVNGGNEGDYMKISSDDPASGPYAMKIGMTEIPTGMNCWLDLRRSDMAVPGYNIPFDASGTDRVTFWIKAEEGTAPLWFMAQSFEPNFEPATNPDYGEKQLTVNAFIDGETIIMEDGTGELKTLRDTHFNGEWQFVSLPWKFLTMKDSAAVDALLPWSLAWEGSTKDSDGDNTEFDVSRIRTLKWFPKPESDGLMNKYWASAENLWGPPGILALPGEWEVDEIKFSPSNTVTSYPKELAIWNNEMMAPNPDKINAITGLPQRYGTKDEPGSENIVRWCVNGGNEGDYMKISSDGPASGPYAMKIGMTEIPTGMNCWLDLRRSDMVVPGYNIPFDANETDKVTFWIKAEEGTAPLWFMAQSFEPNFEPATNPDYGEKQLTVNAFIDGETIIMEDGTGELKTLRDTHFNGEWQFVSLPWKFLTMKDSAAVDALLPWSLAWEGSTKDSDGDNTEFDVSRIRTLKWFPKPESDGLMNNYWASAENLWGPPGILALPGEWELDEIYFTSNYTANYDGITGVEGVKEEIPAAYELQNAYPNPFNPSTSIRFAIPVSNHVKVVVYDVVGRKVRTLINGYKSAGTHNVTWNGINEVGNSVSTGIYFIRMESSRFVSTKKVIMLK